MALTDADGTIRYLSYDSASRLVTETDQRGFVTSRIYGPAYRHIATDLPDGGSETLQTATPLKVERRDAAMQW